MTDSTLTINVAPGGRRFRLEASQWLPVAREELFQFFADATNLQRLTPPWLHFSIVTAVPFVMQAGTLIDYRLRLRGLPLRWRSRISVWEPPLRFVDEQLRGPYRYWRHEHLFEEEAGGTRCRDLVEYNVLGGRLVHRFLVRPDLEKIFAYRQQALKENFTTKHTNDTKGGEDGRQGHSI